MRRFRRCGQALGLPSAIAVLPVLLVACWPVVGGPADGDDDDDLVDDDDASLSAPVVSELEIGPPSFMGPDCIFWVRFDIDDEDGDLNGSEATVAFDDLVYTWGMNLGDPPYDSHVFYMPFEVGESAVRAFVFPNETYDVRVWALDAAGNESNHLVEPSWQSPGTDCE